MYSRFNPAAFALTILLVLCAHNATHPQTRTRNNESQERGVSVVVGQMLDAFVRKDFEALRALWDSSSSELKSFELESRTTHAEAENIRVENLRFSRWRFEGASAEVRVSFTWAWRDESTGGQVRRPNVWDFILVRSEGGWLLRGWDVPRAHLGSRLVAQPDRASRLAFLEGVKELLDLSIIKAMFEAGEGRAVSGRPGEGWTYVNAACDAAEVLGDLGGLARCEEARGVHFSHQYRLGEALDSLRAALRLYRRAADWAGMRMTHLRIGNAHVYRGELEEALRSFEVARDYHRMTAGRRGDAVALKQIGVVYQSMGRYGEALLSFEESLIAAAEDGDDLAQASTHVNIGNLYFLTGEPGKAERAYREGLRIFEEAGDEEGEAGARINLGNHYSSARLFGKAHEQYELSLRIGRQKGDPRIIMSGLSGLGHIHLLEGEYREAEAKYSESLGIARGIGDPEQEADKLLRLGHLKFITGRDAEALENYKRARRLADSIGDVDTTFRCDNLMGDLYRRQKAWGQAAEEYKLAIEGIERTRALTVVPFLQTSFFERYTSPYRRLSEIAFETGKVVEAFTAGERAKARTLVDLMRSGHVTLSKSLTAHEREEERRLLDEVTSVTNHLDRLSSSTSAAAEALRLRLEAARSAHESFRERLYLKHRELRARLARFDPLTLEEIGRAYFEGRPGLRLLSYLVSEDGVWLFALKPGASPRTPAKLSAYRLKSREGNPLTVAELRGRVANFRLKCASPSAPYSAVAHDLFELLVAPASVDLEGATHVVVVPDGILLTLPFQALKDPQGKHLIEKYSLSYAPSVTALQEMMKLSDRRNRRQLNRTKGRTGTALVMGVRSFEETAKYRGRDLPWAEEQAREVAALFGVVGFGGSDSTEGRAKSLVSGRRFVHFATHGEVNSVSPMYSAVVLKKSAGEDGWLYAREIMDLDLRAELVSLAACETALGQETSGEGLLGLSWALFVAGAPSSILTQWQVQDASTSRLMVDFYRRLSENGFKNKAVALQHAQRNMLESESFRHPFYWAPLVLTGDWR